MELLGFLAKGRARAGQEQERRASAKGKCEGQVRRAIDLSFRLRLHSGLRQGGRGFGVGFCGTRERVPFVWEMLVCGDCRFVGGA